LLFLKEHLNYFETGCITYIIYAVQKENTVNPRLVGLSTRVCFRN
jgi:hypothetical protein